MKEISVNPLFAIDFYKADHRRQYPEGTEYVYSNFTPRSNHLYTQKLDDYDGKIVWGGLQKFVRWFLKDKWNEYFFARPKDEVLAEYKALMDNSLGPNAFPLDHIADLHDLGYLPLRVKSLPEGVRVNMRIPVMTIVNTDPRFFWLVNYLETVLSAELWKTPTAATIAYEYRRLLELYAERTGAPKDFVAVQGHDFSSRGMSGIWDSASTGIGHLYSFIGTDSVAAIDMAMQAYDANPAEGPIGVSVFATEHSVMCMGSKEGEYDTIKRLITELYPTGIISIVSDTWDFWKVLTVIAPKLKEEIQNRKPDAMGLAKVVFRPDSGDPVKIIVGDPDAKKDSPAYKGAVECLWEIFGGTINTKGYKALNERVGLIYGDSITLKRAKQILHGLEEKGFASNNIVFGIGSYTYQFVSRDTFGWAMKATWGQVKGQGIEIFKDPVTDNGVKKSAKGLLHVAEISSEYIDSEYILTDQVTPELEKGGALKIVLEDGVLFNQTTLNEIRARLYGE